MKRLRDARNSQPSIAVLVRTKNEIDALPAFWESLEKQTIFSRTEVIVLDSGSNDGTAEYLLNKPCALYSLPHEQFQFGSSCNQAASLAAAPLLAYFSGHVVLENEKTLEILVNILEREPLSAAYMRQVPKAGSNSIYDRAYLARRFPAGPQVRRVSGPGSFSNAASALTRAAWQRLHFPDVAASEDYLWARQHLRLGGTIYYLPQLTVQHSHAETPQRVYSRVRLNMEARGLQRSLLKSWLYTAGIFVRLIREGGSLRESRAFAAAHGRAYR